MGTRKAGSGTPKLTKGPPWANCLWQSCPQQLWLDRVTLQAVILTLKSWISQFSLPDLENQGWKTKKNASARPLPTSQVTGA